MLEVSGSLSFLFELCCVDAFRVPAAAAAVAATVDILGLTCLATRDNRVMAVDDMLQGPEKGIFT